MHFPQENLKNLKNTLFEYDNFNSSNASITFRKDSKDSVKNLESGVIFCQKKLTTATSRKLQIGKY